ncbi:hypothetical protein FRB96_000932 [Tulasnella sp. 330]|nr:hypothetical protein FRB96_000932 [Tulasnella sp. 330]
MFFTPSTIAAAAIFFTATSVSAGRRLGKRCTGTISSLSDVSAAVECTTITINAFTVPAGEQFLLDLADGTTVNVEGDVTFAFSEWAGPLFEIEGSGVTFNGNGYTFNGNGPSYWDGLGSNGGVTKPKFMKVKNSGVFKNLIVLNSPEQAFSIGNDDPLTIDGITVDDSAGDATNSASDGLPAGHNTDGFDVSASNVVIQNSIVKNQDDCLAINKGSNITFQNNQCSGGHGISIGSITSDVTVSDINILNNKVSNSVNCLRIKMDADASGSTVSDITYTGNACTTITGYGVLIDQSYPDTLGTPGTGVILTNVEFTSGNTVSVSSGADEVDVNCGSGACTGTWNWSGLTTSGGDAGKINYSGITGYPNSGTVTTTKTSTTTSKTSTTTTKATTTTTSTTKATTTTTTTTKATTTSTTATSTATGTVAEYYQCGGTLYSTVKTLAII